MDCENLKKSLNFDVLNKYGTVLTNNTFLTDQLANLWLIIPFITYILFKMISKHLTGSLIKYMQMLYVLLSFGIVFYFVDKKSCTNKFKSAISSFYNSLIMFTVLVVCVDYNPLVSQMTSSKLHMVNGAILVFLFNILVAMTNKNEEQNNNLPVLIAMVVLHIVRIHLGK